MIEPKHARKEAQRLQLTEMHQTRQHRTVCNVDSVETHALERVSTARQKGKAFYLPGKTAQCETNVLDVKMTELGHAESVEKVLEILRLHH